MNIKPTFEVLPPLGLYVHFPWCVKKCPYCDFNSHQQNGEIPQKAYIDKLIEDLEQDLGFVQQRKLQSVFFGGGTPSLFAPQQLSRLLEAIRSRFGLEEDIEITLEANPGTFEQRKFKEYRAIGINRLSLGVQSFDGDSLRALGRIHDGAEAFVAYSSAVDSGFANLNLDLMYGLPGQSLDQAMNDLYIACSLAPAHISWYQLTIEQNTEFYNKPPQLPDEELLWSIFTEGASYLRSQSYGQYEVSAWSKPDTQSMHNKNYWQFGDYIGLGAGAHGKITDMNSQQIIRYRKTRSPQDYLSVEGEFRREERFVNSQDLAGEFMLNALRLTEGFSCEQFEATTGLQFSVISDQVNWACNDELLIRSGATHWQVSERGGLFLDDLAARFLA